MLTKHEHHACKECKGKYSSFMELLMHIASQHFKESDEEIERKVQSENVENENENRDDEKKSHLSTLSLCWMSS